MENKKGSTAARRAAFEAARNRQSSSFVGVGDKCKRWWETRLQTLDFLDGSVVHGWNQTNQGTAAALEADLELRAFGSFCART